jgi:hypothetical protein
VKKIPFRTPLLHFLFSQAVARLCYCVFTMKCFVLAYLALVQVANGFQFMSNWKLPTPIDFEQEKAVKEKFGDKSTLFPS